ncbi:MAG TPA: tetratricopeptide repeat protein [Thermoanaerobaculia bacterium]
MKKIPLALVVVAAAATAGCFLHVKHREKSTEPFYRKYLVAGNELDDRIADQERRVEAEPGSADLRNDFGNLLAERHFVEDARLQYEKALELDSTNFLAAYNLGLLFEAEGRPTKAIWAFRKSTARKPGFPQAHFRLGRLYEQRGWDRLAVKEYAKALRLDPQMRDPRTNSLIVDTRLLDRISLENYSRDIAVASMNSDQVFADEGRFHRAPIDRPLSSKEIGDLPAPEPVDATVTAPAKPAVPKPLPLQPGQTRPQQGLPAGTPPLLPPAVPPPPPPTPLPTPLP